MDSTSTDNMWQLERLGFPENIITLKQGITTVGRLPQSNIVLESLFCSREHCSFIVSETNEVTILDKSSNGVFVNEKQFLKQEVKLEENFIIGIGCSLNSNFEENPQYNIFKLKKKKNSSINNIHIDDVKSDIDVLVIDDDVYLKKEDIKVEIINSTNITSQEINGVHYNRDCNKNQHDAGYDTTGIEEDKVNLRNLLDNVKGDSNILEIDDAKFKFEIIDCSNIDPIETNSIDYYEEDCNKNNIQLFNISQEYDDDGIINIISDDEEDEITINWMVKLSQNITLDDIKKEKINDASSFDVEYETEEEKIDKQVKLNELIIKIENTSNEQKVTGNTDRKSDISGNFENNNSRNYSGYSNCNDYRTDKNILNLIKDCSVVIENCKISKKKSKVSDINLISSKRDERVKIIEKECSLSDTDAESDSSPVVNNKKKTKRYKSVDSSDEDYTISSLKKQINSKLNPSVLAIKKPTTKPPFIIDAPYIPKRRLSTAKIVPSPTVPTSSKGSVVKITKQSISKNRDIIKRNVIAACKKDYMEKNLKDKWKTVEKKSINLSDVRKEERRKKLKELASLSNTKEAAPKKKLVKPRVKLTEQNRGSFLVEENSLTAVKALPIIKRANDKKISGNVKPIQVVSYPKVKKMRFSDIDNASERKIIVPPITKQLLLVNKKSCIKNKSFVRKINKCVTFNEVPDVHFYLIEEGNSLMHRTIHKDGPTPRKIAEYGKQQLYQNQFKTDKFENVINNITRWKPLWLKQNWIHNSTPPVNGDDYTIFPILHSFKNLVSYILNFIPLMNIELFRIIHEKSNIKQVLWDKIWLLQINKESRANNFRYVYHCKVPLLAKEKNPADGDFILIEFFDELGMLCSFFAYCVGIRWNTENNFIKCTFESSVTNITENLTMQSKIKSIRKLLNIKNELYSFLSVFSLDRSPLVNHVLQPLEYIKVNPVNQDMLLVEIEPLNYFQKKILMQTYAQCLNITEPNMMIIQGPPGTGKSRLITNLVMQLRYGREMKKGIKILFCAPSNNAVDLIAVKLSNLRQEIKINGEKIKLVRFGIFDKMAEMAKKISSQTFAERIAYSKFTNLLKDKQSYLIDEFNFLKEIIKTFEQIKDLTNIQKEELKNYRQKFDKLNKLLNCSNNSNPEYYKLYKEAQRVILNGADIVCTTLSSCSSLRNYVSSFDICIIDEASQCSEPMTLLPFQFGVSKVILVGDTYQLPAIISSKIAQDNGLGNSLFSRFCSCYKNNLTSPILSLTQQYRMNPEICRWPNLYFYNNSLINDLSCINNNRDLPLKPYTIFSLRYFQKNSNTFNDNFKNYNNINNNNSSSISISNNNEADFVINLVKKLIVVADPKLFSYGIITPYFKQKNTLKQKLDATIGENTITVNTIDSYQGQERDIIIISTVRTDGIGFLNNYQRLNVSLTRAKKCLIICGNFISLKESNTWKDLLIDAYKRNIVYEISDSTTDHQDIINYIRK